MAKIINRYDNKSLSELEWQVGELVALHNRDIEFQSPLVLLSIRDMVQGFYKEGVNVLFYPQNGKKEEWTIKTFGNSFQLWCPYPNIQEGEIPNIICFERGFPESGAYLVEEAIAGRENIIGYLRENYLGIYAEVLESGKPLGKFASR